MGIYDEMTESHEPRSMQAEVGRNRNGPTVMHAMEELHDQLKVLGSDLSEFYAKVAPVLRTDSADGDDNRAIPTDHPEGSDIRNGIMNAVRTIRYYRESLSDTRERVDL